MRPLLDELGALHSFFLIDEKLAQALVPGSVVDIVRMGILTALSKPDGGVRGIVEGDVIRHLVARTISQQLASTVERATSPHQYAMTTRAGCECVAHALQGLTELDPQATVTSIDGVGALGLISRRAMLEGLREVNAAAVPFARLFYGQRSEYMWEDDFGETHTISQGEGGEQGNAMMPLLFFPRPTPCSRGGGPSLDTRRTPSRVLGRHFLCGLHFTGRARSTTSLRCLCGGMQASESTWDKTQLLNRAGTSPIVCDRLERAAQGVNPNARVWRGSLLPTDRQGIKVLGTPLGHPDFVARHLQAVVAEH